MRSTLRVCAVILIVGCRTQDPPPRDAGAAPVVLEAAAESSASIAARAIVTQWNEALNAKDMSRLQPLYGERVHYYGVTLLAADCVAKAAKTPAFHQDITVSKVDIRDASHVRVLFAKTTAAGPHVYACYLVLEQSDAGTWKIIEESDSETDTNVATAASKCLTYNAPVALAGTARVESMGKVKMWFLHLDTPVCVVRTSDEMFGPLRLDGVDDMQVMDGDKLTNGGHVTLTGVLFARNTGHQYTDVFLDNLPHD